MIEKTLSLFLHKRGGTILLAAVALVCSIFAQSEVNLPTLSDKGLLITSPNLWISPGWASWGISIAIYGFITFLMLYINRTFNLLRSMTMLFCGAYLIINLATPELIVQFYGGPLVCAVILTCAIIFFSIYGNTAHPRRVFLAFFLTSLTAMCQYAILFYIPALLLGCAQMRIFNTKSMLAALFGLITPPWLLIGLGIVSIDAIHPPSFVNYFSALGTSERIPIMVSIGFTMFLGIGFSVANLIKIYGYNSRSRAYNGFFSLMMLSTLLLIIFDFTESAIYVPMLNCCTAYQIGHFFTLRRTRRSYIPIISTIICYIGLYFWNLWT